MADDVLTRSEARRIALAAQGLDRPRPRRADAGQLTRTVRRLGLLQIDYVNVLVPAQYQVPFSRLGPYPRSRLDGIVYRRRQFTEQWAHEASIVPMDAWPLLRHRRESFGIRPRRFAALVQRHAGYVDWVLEQVRERGPLAADDLPDPEGLEPREEGAWYRSWPRIVLELHFGRGAVAVSERRANFSRVYDAAERVVPRDHADRRLERAEAQRELLVRAARAHGVGTAADLADYYRMPVSEARPRLGELVDAGELREARVQGWKDRAYLYPGARSPRRVDAATLLSPFDPAVWFRPRVARLFGFDYRIEIFVPAPKRRFGYYVLPFLLGDRLVARVDLKADRAAGRLRVPAAYLEDGAEPRPVAAALAAELRTWAEWLELDGVAVGRRGNLARALAAALRG